MPGSIDKYDSMQYRAFTGKSEFDKAIHTLEGIIKGISIDDEIDLAELRELSAWCKTNYDLIDRQPYKELIPYIEDAIADNYLDNEEQENILWYCRQFSTENTFYDMVTSDIQRLQGMLHGILADNKITEKEVRQLSSWLSENQHLNGIYPYDELSSLITAVLADGVLDSDEEKQLKVFFWEHVLPVRHGGISKEEIEEYKKTISISGVCATEPTIVFDNMRFCFTGKSSKTKRSELVKIVEERNGIYTNSISKNLDYLVVGDNGNPCWAYSCYGRKVEQAITLRKEGQRLVIAHENDFWKIINQ